MTCEHIVTSRLLILQSKRLMLTSLERRASRAGAGTLRERAGRLRAEADLAQYAYRCAMLEYGEPERAEYWVNAYSRLVEMGNALTGKLRRSAPALAPAERYEMAADVEMLEGIVGRWTRSMQTSMSASLA